MFIKVTRAAACSYLTMGYQVRLDATGEIVQLLTPEGCSKRHARRILSRMTSWGPRNPRFSVRI